MLRDPIALMAILVALGLAWTVARARDGGYVPPPILSKDWRLGYNGFGTRSCCLARFDRVGRDGSIRGMAWIHNPGWWLTIGPFEIVTPEGHWTLTTFHKPAPPREEVTDVMTHWDMRDPIRRQGRGSTRPPWPPRIRTIRNGVLTPIHTP
jgi:hypothetical protein